MPRVPQPDPTPRGPAWRGRLLPRPDEDVVDQGAGFDVATLLSRRRLLGIGGGAAAGLALAACSSDAGTGSAAASTSAGEIPDETNGPYPADGTAALNVLERSGIVRRDITSSLDGGGVVAGVPLHLTLRVRDLARDAPYAGAAVYVWQCDAEGRYSMYSSGVEDQTWLRGVQVADAEGRVRFTSIVPGCYAGRWTHVHLEVYPDAESATDVANVVATSQIAFPPEMLGDVYALDTYPGSADNLAAVGVAVADDQIFGEGDWQLQVPRVSGDVESGYVAVMDVGVDTTTEPATGGGPGGGAPPDGGGPGGPPPEGERPGS